MQVTIVYFMIFPNLLSFIYIEHIISYNPGINDVKNICITVAKSIIACPTIIGKGFLFL